MPPQLVSIKDAAAHYDVYPTTVRRWIAAGRLVAYRTGPKLLRVDISNDDNLMHQVPTMKAAAS